MALFDNSQIGERCGESLNSYTLEDHIHDLIVILNAAVEHDPLAPDLMTDMSPGAELHLHDGSRGRVGTSCPQTFRGAAVEGASGARFPDEQIYGHIVQKARGVGLFGRAASAALNGANEIKFVLGARDAHVKKP